MASKVCNKYYELRFICEETRIWSKIKEYFFNVAVVLSLREGVDSGPALFCIAVGVGGLADILTIDDTVARALHHENRHSNHHWNQFINDRMPLSYHSNVYRCDSQLRATRIDGLAKKTSDDDAHR
jgi:hypothetical protein